MWRQFSLILRRQDIYATLEADDIKTEGCYMLKGPCYVNEIMDGEAAQNLERDAVEVHLV